MEDKNIIIRDKKGRFLEGSHVKTEFQKGSIGYWTGRHLSEETKRKLSESHKGQRPWMKGKHPSEKVKEILSKTEFKKGQTPWNKGLKGFLKGHPGYMLDKKQSEEAKQKIRESCKGNKCYNWKGGLTPLALKIRNNFKYRQWISDIFYRDDFTCQECGKRGGDLEAHHIKSFSSILQFYEITTLEEALNCEELWNINNGITLCVECHKEIYSGVLINA